MLTEFTLFFSKKYYVTRRKYERVCSDIYLEVIPSTARATLGISPGLKWDSGIEYGGDLDPSPPSLRIRDLPIVMQLG